MNPDSVFFIIIFTTLALCFGGIAYFHLTGQAKWAEEDKEMTISWLVGVAVSIPYVFIIYHAMTYASHNILPKVLSSLPASARPSAGFLFMAGVLWGVVGLLHLIHQCLVAKWKPWQRLDSSVKRGQKQKRTWDISELLKQFHKWRKER